jgi:hypothetical protein
LNLLRYPLRGYDAVHLATAVNLDIALRSAGLPPLVFVSADHSLCEAAQDEKLSSDDPNVH